MFDYFSLLKTRYIVRLLSNRRISKFFTFPILVTDYLVYLFACTIAMFLAYQIYERMSFGRSGFWELLESDELVLNLMRFFGMIMEDNFASLFTTWDSPPEILNNALFWSGFAPSLWMWLYVFALFLTSLLLRSASIVHWLRWFLNVEKNPFRSIGAVAAALAFIASVAIILVSAEVSRISAAV